MRDHPVLTVRLVYLARLREAFALGAESLPLPGPGEATVAQVLEVLRRRGGAFAAELAEGRSFRIAVNHAIVGTDHPIRDGDELALFPPVTGG